MYFLSECNRETDKVGISDNLRISSHISPFKHTCMRTHNPCFHREW